jgi:formylglycine-generating enzyme required for sulfatase activity
MSSLEGKMKLVNLHRKPIAVFVMITFTILLCYWSDHVQAAPGASAQKKNSPASLEKEVNGITVAYEKEKPAPASKKGKRFPWLLAGLGVVAVAVLVVLLTKKKDDTTQDQVDSYRNGILMIGGVRYELVSIPGGEFQMGSNSEEAYAIEKPVHTVRISQTFWLGKTEVTQGLWQAVMGSNPAYFQKGVAYPVELVTWDDCQDFITRLNQKIGGNFFRLPTEAEWEYACRAGTAGDYYGAIDSIGWYDANSGNSTHPVSQKQANAFGLYDMAGNVWEWCQDWYEDYSAGYQTDPVGPVSGSDRIFRGGSWDAGSAGLRSSFRGARPPNYYYYTVGLRLSANSAGG